MIKLLCPSLMCADFKNLEKEIKSLDEAGSDIFHIDIMDGEFVPNFGMGVQDIEAIRSLTNKPIDVHLMIENPKDKLDIFLDLDVDIIYFHPETASNSIELINQIQNKDVKAGIAINPSTSICSIEELLPFIDNLLVMTVNPGFAGQKYISTMDDKIEKLVTKKNKYNYEIFVDGAISNKKIEKLSRKGVKGFILGTSALFDKDRSYSSLLTEYRTS